MTEVMSVEQASTRLAELIRCLGPADEIVLTDDTRPVARLVFIRQARPRRIAGMFKGMLTVVAEDDDHLSDFADYMP